MVLSFATENHHGIHATSLVLREGSRLLESIELSKK
jgi:hypothetical protein